MKGPIYGKFQQNFKNIENLECKVENAKKHSIATRIALLEPVIEKLRAAPTIAEKLSILDCLDTVKTFLEEAPFLRTSMARFTQEERFIIKMIIALGEGGSVFRGIDNEDSAFQQIDKLVKNLLNVERFYAPIGGIAGYHVAVLKLLQDKKNGFSEKTEKVTYSKPQGLDLFHTSSGLNEAIRWGIEYMPRMSEIYPVGGAGDRFNLHDEKTGEDLPIAELVVFGYSLLEGLVRDLQAREYLYYKFFHLQLMTPIAMMTSEEKNNNQRIHNLCASKKWFGRPKDNFRFFIQPLVPVMNEEGHWCIKSSLKVLFKPGGHGVVWKLAIDTGVFDWMERLQKTKVLVRQINNPIAGVDDGLLAFTGLGLYHDKSIGFASCHRLLKASEGMNVFIEKATDTSYTYCLTNVEYTDFSLKGIEDIPETPGSPFSAFPTNTNILFADLKKIREATQKCCIPGMLINMKARELCLSERGEWTELHVGRLESTMQNIADYIVDSFPQPIDPKMIPELQSYITFNERRKTISVTKKTFIEGQSFLETPEGCFYDLLLNSRELLTQYCQIEVPDVPKEDAFIENGPSFILHYHPALGPLFSIIGKKIRYGRMAENAEWLLEIAEVDIENINLEGSFHLLAEQVLGHVDSQGILRYSSFNGKCTLRNVSIVNQGIDRSVANQYWKNEVNRKECLKIIIHGNGEFIAEDVTFTGNHIIEVPDGYLVIAYSEGKEVKFMRRKIVSPTWYWEYHFGAKGTIDLEKVQAANCLKSNIR